MDSAVSKALRAALRKAQEQIVQSHIAQGARRETVDLVDVITHPRDPALTLNYITPRRGAAYVSAAHVQAGVQRLRELDRVPVFQYMEALLPPLFAKTLRDAGFAPVSAAPMLVYAAEGLGGVPVLPLPDAQADTTCEIVNTPKQSGQWKRVWKLAKGGALPVGSHLNLLVRCDNVPVGAARIIYDEDGTTAQIVGLALLPQRDSDDVLRAALIAGALRVGLEAGCEMVFMLGAPERDRQIAYGLGCLDAGDWVRYQQI